MRENLPCSVMSLCPSSSGTSITFGFLAGMSTLVLSETSELVLIQKHNNYNMTTFDSPTLEMKLIVV